ncbi:lactate dehydrogenase [Fructilactobacillus hinvesii]|uniref:Lactate dehydrogenase n=1 Tax=Fructilactobacillus hinvesii TaxID=2940300 RepID=A0ABY5BUE1_9LACO|nr:lactate dehydrogenase [Fructilactobacillus hinvesii]USS87283.1 lactate dehydrogenase [Fructilactobacillus hinvesii]
MQAPILIKGNPTRVHQLTTALAMMDLPVTLLCEDQDENAELLGTRACRHFRLEALKPDADLSMIDTLIYLPALDFYAQSETDATKIAPLLAPEIDELRTMTNDVMERAFQGKIIVNAPHDEVFLYFLASFSGLDVNKLMGVGNVPVGLMLREQLIDNFKVSDEDVNVSACGLNTNCVLAWNRIYVGSSSLLSYVASPTNNYDTDLIGKVQQTVTDPQVVVNPVLQIQAIVKLLACLTGAESAVHAVVSLEKKSDQIALNQMPKLVNCSGLAHELPFKLADAEADELDYNLNWSTEIIEQIKKERQHEEAH